MNKYLFKSFTFIKECDLRIPSLNIEKIMDIKLLCKLLYKYNQVHLFYKQTNKNRKYYILLYQEVKSIPTTSLQIMKEISSDN